jgi:hypothetical protein
MVELAQELIDIIVDSVSICDNAHAACCSGQWASDRSTLQACALVSPAFLVSSQRCLFRSLTLRGKADAVSGLAQQPHLPSYVRDLRINLWLGADPGLAAILPLFNGVHRLVVDSGWALWVTTPFHGDFQTAFLSFLRTPTLRCLGLLNCLGVPSSFICLALSSYREVALINIDIREGHPSTYSDRLQVPISGPATKLDRLVLDGSSKDRVSLHGILLSKDKSPLLRLEVEHLELFVQMQKSLYGLGIAHLYSFSLQTLVIHFRGSFFVLDFHLPY